MLVSVSSKTRFEQWSMLRRRGKFVLEGATFKGKNMLLMRSIFFLFIVAPVNIENNFKGPYIEKPPKLMVL